MLHVIAELLQGFMERNRSVHIPNDVVIQVTIPSPVTMDSSGQRIWLALCCRRDELQHVPAIFPSPRPFILLPVGVKNVSFAMCLKKKSVL